MELTIIILSVSLIIIMISCFCLHNKNKKLNSVNEELKEQNQQLIEDAIDLETKITEYKYSHEVVYMTIIHDLQNVLLGIQMLSKADIANGAMRPILQEIHENSKRYYSQAKNVLKDIFEGDSVKISIESFSPLNLVKEIAKPFGEKVRVIESSYGQLSDFKSNRELLRLIITELITNAVKYNNSATKSVQVIVGKEKVSDWLKIEISNSGQPNHEINCQKPETYNGNGLGTHLSYVLTKTLNGNVKYFVNDNTVHVMVCIPIFKNQI